MFSTYPMVCQTECLDSYVRVNLRSNKPQQSAGRLPRFCNAVSKAAVARRLISEFVISQTGKQNVNMSHYFFLFCFFESCGELMQVVLINTIHMLF